jgi:hypothetical protein
VFAAPGTFYELELLVADGDIIDGITLDRIGGGTGCVSINNHGVVVFRARTSFGDVILTQHGAIAAPGDVIDGLTVTGFPTDTPTINELGEVAFVGDFVELAGYPGVVVMGQTEEVRVRSGDTIGSHTLEFFRVAAIDDTGNVTFFALTATGRWGVFTPDTALVLEGDTIDGRTISRFRIIRDGLSVNSLGDVAFHADQCLFTLNEVLAAPGDVIDGKTLLGVGGDAKLCFNDHGEIAFRAAFGDDGETSVGVFAQDRLVVQNGDRVAGFTLSGFWGLAFNNGGIVAFRPNVKHKPRVVTRGVFTQFGPIVMFGERIGGKTFSDMGGDSVSLNDKGEVAFIAEFTDRSHGVVIARPFEPSVLADIRPGSDSNSVNPDSRGVIPVAILTTSKASGDPLDFDATEVDPDSVEFGPAGATMDCSAAHLKDVDGDGDTDLLLHFRCQETGIVDGQRWASLTGTTYGGRTITGADWIKTVGAGK